MGSGYGYYCVKGHHELEREPTGTSGRLIWRDLETHKGAMARARRTYPEGFTLWHFKNFYDNSTFDRVGQE